MLIDLTDVQDTKREQGLGLYRESIYTVLDTAAARRIDVKSMPEKLVKLKDPRVIFWHHFAN